VRGYVGKFADAGRNLLRRMLLAAFFIQLIQVFNLRLHTST
jgi:hypothetical protein